MYHFEADRVLYLYIRLLSLEEWQPRDHDKETFGYRYPGSLR